MLTQEQLNQLWDVATKIGKVEGWSADDQGDVHLLVPVDRERHYHYERPASDGNWKHAPGMASR